METEEITSCRLENRHIAMTILPEYGGKIISLKNNRTGREWLWKHPTLPLRPPANPDGYHDSGGHDECFPTIAGCEIHREDGSKVAILDHGELWPLPWVVNRYESESEGGGVIDLHVDIERLNCRFRRVIQLEGDSGHLRMDYELENRGACPLPFLWAGHALVPLEAGMRLEFPDSAQARVEIVIGPWPGGEKGVYPMKDLPGVSVIPDPGASEFEGYCLKAFVENLSEGWATLRTVGGEMFRFRFSTDKIDSIALWLNCRGWAGTGPDPYFNLGFEPMIGAGDSLAEELSNNKKTGVVAPGAIHQWSIEIDIS
ncbi:MAG: DUF5107 domain-containing protein [Candidatus Sumerlaeia bacterium]|nr:DUF5107 domain-containing protein [Candidatus Sumerlaeia bacterium]